MAKSKGIVVNKKNLEALIKQACIDKNTCPSASHSWIANGGLCPSVNSKKGCMKCWIEALKGG